MDNTAAQRFDDTKFSERKPFRKFGAIEPPFTVSFVRFDMFDSTKFSETTPFGKFASVEPLLFAVSICNG